MNKTAELDRLLSHEEDLLNKLAAGEGPEIAALRDRVDQALLEAWSNTARIHAAADSVEEFPWVAVTIGAVLGGIIGYFWGKSPAVRRR